MATRAASAALRYSGSARHEHPPPARPARDSFELLWWPRDRMRQRPELARRSDGRRWKWKRRDDRCGRNVGRRRNDGRRRDDRRRGNDRRRRDDGHRGDVRREVRYGDVCSRPALLQRQLRPLHAARRHLHEAGLHRPGLVLHLRGPYLHVDRRRDTRRRHVASAVRVRSETQWPVPNAGAHVRSQGQHLQHDVCLRDRADALSALTAWPGRAPFTPA